MNEYTPTKQQEVIIKHEGSAFVSACPGAGKTRCIISRAERALAASDDGRGLVFLSFTKTAVSELEDRLANDGLLPNPPLPHFLGTFDSFLWKFFVAPFGMNGCEATLKLIPDTGTLTVFPFPDNRGHALPLFLFDRRSGKLDTSKAKKKGFKGDPKWHEAAAKRLRKSLLKKSLVDFDDARAIAISNLEEGGFSKRLAFILRARFKEIIVDEAQDCNPDDLAIVAWLRDVAKINTKVVCDPNQSIYEFRGGVSSQLIEFSKTFEGKDRLGLTGNFRSTNNICKTVHALRAPSVREDCDTAMGAMANQNVAIRIFSYEGQKVTSKIGEEFSDLALVEGISLDSCRLVAKTRNSGLNAVGAYGDDSGNRMCLKIARASKMFQHATLREQQLKAVAEGHKIALEIAGRLDGRSYHQALEDDGLDELSWRGTIVGILRSLEFNVDAEHNRQEWVARAQSAYSQFLPTGHGTIAQKIQNSKDLDGILTATPTSDLCPCTIHEVKGKQYLGVCVVLTTATTKAIISHLESEPDETAAEDCRELYVAASRAEKLLAIACPKSQSTRLAKHLISFGSNVELVEI